MVALSSSTVARSGVRMVAWTIGVLIALLSTLVHASPNFKFGDVSGDEVVIDHLEDFLRSHNPHNPQRLDAQEENQPHRHHQKVNEKIKFGVSPQDPRYYDPIPLERRSKPSEGELLQYLPPNLNVLGPRLQQQPQYPADPLQYPDEEVQYPAQYVQEEQYPEQYPARYPGYPNLRLPEEALISDPRLDALQNLREEVVEARDGLPEELRDDERGEAKRVMTLHGLGEERVRDSGSPLMEEGDDAEEKKKKAAVKAATSQPEEAVNYIHRSHADAQSPGYKLDEVGHQSQFGDVYFTAIVAGCTAAAVCAVIGAGICWYRLNKSHRAAQDTEYPAYGVTGPNKDLSPTSGDRKLAQSAHMYHYQHQKQQMIALEKSSGGERHGSTSDVDSEEEGEENEYTVYECPGLAPTGEMEVKNPLFQDDPTPATPSVRKDQEEDEDEDEEEELEQNAK